MSYRRCFRNFILTLFSACVLIGVYNYYNHSIYSNCGIKAKFVSNVLDSKSNLKIKQHLLKALRYTRSQNVREEILGALSIISNFVDTDKKDFVINRIKEITTNNNPHDVCLDKYLGRIDHPLYNKGQGEINCNKKPFQNVLTFIIIINDCREFLNIVNGIKKNYSKSKIVVGITNKVNCDFTDQLISIETIKSNAQGILSLLAKVKTDYVNLAPNIYHFDNQSKIERLVQMVSYTDVEIAAGGVRLENGQYQSGCYQMAMKMYTLKLVHGYDMSFNSCLYCDYSPAPFVARTNFLVEQFTKLKHSTTENGLSMFQLFSALMVNNHRQILVCPDVLFHVKQYDLSQYNRSEWFSFVSWFGLNRLLLDGGMTLEFNCAESNLNCNRKKGIMVPLCCLKELSDSLKFMNRLLKRQNVTFEVLEGTVMGGLKFNNILFWELDADTNFRVQAIDQLEKKLDVLKKQGYTMNIEYHCPHKRDHDQCRRDGWHGSIYYSFRTSNWRTEMYGVTYILSDFRGELKEPTKINIDGEWYITYTNPVLYARNIYGGDAFQHVEHKYALGTNEDHYASVFDGQFSQCPQPGFHGCLSNFVGEGGLQFQDVFL